jgi:hypothetical protein
MVGTRATVNGRGRSRGEQVRALAQLEADEGDRAGRLTRDGMTIAIEHRNTVLDEHQRRHGESIAASLKAFMRELGIDERAPEAYRAAHRAVVTARRSLGHDEATGTWSARRSLTRSNTGSPRPTRGPDSFCLSVRKSAPVCRVRRAR